MAGAAPASRRLWLCAALLGCLALARPRRRGKTGGGLQAGAAPSAGEGEGGGGRRWGRGAALVLSSAELLSCPGGERLGPFPGVPTSPVFLPDS